MKMIIATYTSEQIRNILTWNKITDIRTTVPGDYPFKVLLCEKGSGGKIKGEFTCMLTVMYYILLDNEVLKQACMSKEELNNLHKNNRVVYTWDISNVIGFGSEWYPIKNISDYGLSQEPQDWEYV